MERRDASGPGAGAGPSLSPAEQRVLEHVRAGQLDAEIAVRLGVPIGEVKTRVESLMRKLGVSERAGLLSAAAAPATAGTAAPSAAPAPPLVGIVRSRPARPKWRLPVAAALIAAATLGALGAFLAPGGEDARSPATPSATVSDVAGAAAASPTPAPALRVGDGMPLPAGAAMLLLVSCADCGRQFVELRRTWQPGVGIVVDDQLFFAPGGSYIDSVVATRDGYELAMAVCVQRSCSYVTDSGSTKTAIYRSRDGGASWSEEAVLDAAYSVVDLAGQGPLLLRKGPRDERNYAFLDWQSKAAGAISPPPGALVALGDFLWAGSGQVVGSVGEAVFGAPPGGPASFVDAGVAGGGAVWAQWTTARAEGGVDTFVGLRDGGDLYTWPVAQGTRVLGSVRDDLAFGFVDGRLALFALRAGFAYPLAGPFSVPLYGEARSLPIAVVEGPFVRVRGAGSGPADCLNVRANPALGEPVLGCYRDGTLLRLAVDTRGEGPGDGGAWVPVATPGGQAGWASGAFLQVP